MQADEIRLTSESVSLNLSIYLLSRGYPDAVKVEIADPPFGIYSDGESETEIRQKKPFVNASKWGQKYCWRKKK